MTADRAIWQSVQNIDLSSANLDKLWDALDCSCEEDDLDIVCDHDYQLSGWVVTFKETYFSVRRRKNKNMSAAGWVTLTLQLTCPEGDGVVWQHGKRAKLLVGYSPKSWWEFSAADPNASGACEDAEAKELCWVDDAGGWFYAVPLDVLTSEDAVAEYVSKPVHRMICGESAEMVLGPMRDSLCLPPQS